MQIIREGRSLSPSELATASLRFYICIRFRCNFHANAAVCSSLISQTAKTLNGAHWIKWIGYYVHTYIYLKMVILSPSAMHNEDPACGIWGKDKLPSRFCDGGAERLKCLSQYFRMGNSCNSGPLTDWLQIAPLNNPTSKLLKLRWEGIPCDVIRLTA
jgi:hypothetical protein